MQIGDFPFSQTQALFEQKLNLTEEESVMLSKEVADIVCRVGRSQHYLEPWTYCTRVDSDGDLIIDFTYEIPVSAPPLARHWWVHRFRTMEKLGFSSFEKRLEKAIKYVESLMLDRRNILQSSLNNVRRTLSSSNFSHHDNP